MTPAEIEDGGATAISYGQNDSFTQQLMAGALKLKSSLFRQERVSFADIAHNPSLAKRARAEMDNHHFKGYGCFKLGLTTFLRSFCVLKAQAILAHCSIPS